MAPTQPSNPRAAFLQKLKPVCVPLSQLAIRSTDKAASAKEVLGLLDTLVEIWTAQASSDASILDDKLADYVFFPITYLLRSQDQYPVRVIEATIRLLGPLVQYGWKANMPQKLAQQLLVFLSFTIGGIPDQPKKREVPEETIIEGYRAIAAIITATGPSTLISSSSAEGQTISALSHSVSVVLDGISASFTPLIQLEALQCLRAVFTSISDNAILAKFLPGTVSALTKPLSPPLQQKTQARVLVSCLEVLNLVLVSVLADIKMRAILNKTDNATKPEAGPQVEIDDTRLRVELTPAWLKATAAQIKIALSSVLKLRNHESENVQSALDRLCVNLLDECHLSLADCESILVESAMMLEDEERQSSTIQTSLRDLASIYPKLGDSIKSTLYSWITGLPRLMQSGEERIKQIAIRNILRGTKLAAALNIDSSTLDDSLGNSLRDSIVELIRNSKPSKVTDYIGTDGDISSNTDLVGSHMAISTYRPVILNSEGQKTTREEINTLITNVGSSTQQAELATAMLGYLRDSDGVDQIASYWLAFELLKSTFAQSSDLDELFDLSSLEESRSQQQAFQELYDFSASVLSSHSDSLDNDWRLEAIALEVTAFAASRLKADFRPELIDVLYPVTTFLGSQVPQLRGHAITTLNKLASSCGYESVSALIVDNADYMVNSISLRLNTFDISPASTKVLTMMVRLTGPKLIPFLDDVVAAIFAALDNYHGYPIFVESLFSVLSEVVTQGVKSDMLLLEDSSVSKPVDHKKRKPGSLGIKGILAILEQRAERSERSTNEAKQDVTQSHPTKPRGPEKGNEAESLLNSLLFPGGNDDKDDDEGAGEKKPEEEQAVDTPDLPKTPTYSLLSRVLTLTQHYLTSPTPTLRKSLLDLVSTVSPALAPDENAFLPLVNTIWPVAIARLHDPEPFVAVAACRALAALSATAGDFLSSRFKTEWGGGLGNWFAKARAEALKARRGGGGGGTAKGSGTDFGRNGASAASRMLGLRPGASGDSASSAGIVIPSRVAQPEEGTLTQASVSLSVAASPSALSYSSPSSSSSSFGALGRFTQASQVWEAAVGLLGAIVTCVRVDDDMFDEILDLVGDVLAENDAIREALEAVNADAVWLALYAQGRVEWKAEPVVEGVVFARMEVGAAA
ncbi:armadillo-type protein [Podospora appendiculata]|uniref:Armadillo-type protein n=1 Tax=Podospora appendiculata TaxID=314037 RepID=A0AAE0XF67_9PEZI|nr:armadillo-type protein [Podospora appendiculata]